MSMLDQRDVALVRERAAYARTPPFHPSERHPELGHVPLGSEDNPAFRAVRDVLRHLGLDSARFGTPQWNPLAGIVAPGHTVVLKPNMVAHRNLGERHGLTDTDSLVTHGSVIRAVAEYVAMAMDGRGRIIIGDSPIQDTDWDALLALLGIDAMQRDFAERHRGIVFEARDYRIGKAVINRFGVMTERTEGSNEGFVEVDLGAKSLLTPLMNGRYAFGVARYPRHRMRRAHGPEHNYYLFPRDILDADVVINLPKLKTHMKAAVSVAMKNFVGINGHKDYLPHFRFGSPKNGGDEYPDGNWFWDLMWWARHHEWELDRGRAKMAWFGAGWFMKQLLPLFARKPRNAVSLGGGGWHGNDTLWRTVIDITAAFFHYDRQQSVMADSVRDSVRYLAIVDGLVGGHKESPLTPSPVAAGVMLGGLNPLAVDTVAAAVMGFDIERVAQIREAYGDISLRLASFAPTEIAIHGTDGIHTIDDIEHTDAFVPFQPSVGFRGHLERVRSRSSSHNELPRDVDRE